MPLLLLPPAPPTRSSPPAPPDCSSHLLLPTAPPVRASQLVRHAFLLDYEGMGWRHLNPSIFFRLRPIVASLNAHYPEFIGSATLINTPPLFVHLWAIVSPWLSPAVRKRVTTVEPHMTLAAVSKLGERARRMLARARAHAWRARSGHATTDLQTRTHMRRHRRTH